MLMGVLPACCLAGLARSCLQRGHDVRIVLPFYECLKEVRHQQSATLYMYCLYCVYCMHPSCSAASA